MITRPAMSTLTSVAKALTTEPAQKTATPASITFSLAAAPIAAASASLTSMAVKPETSPLVPAMSSPAAGVSE